MENVKRTHRILVPILGALATLALFVGAFAVWVNRQALNTNNWTDTSRKLIANTKIDNALGAYLVGGLATWILLMYRDRWQTLQIRIDKPKAYFL